MSDQDDKKDLTSRDWLAYSTKQLVAAIDPSVCVSFVYNKNGGMKIILEQISSATLENLQLLTNTDQNNNYLYLEDFKVYLNGSIAPLEIPGLLDIAKMLYRQADINQFIAGIKTKTPFSGKMINNTSLNGTSNTPVTFSQFIDALTALIPFTKNTTGLTKTFTVVLNPDGAGGGGWWQK